MEYCSVVWCSAAETHLKLLERAVSDAWFQTLGVFECDIAHRRSAAVLCMLNKIRCNPMHPLNGALSGPYVPVRCSDCTPVYLRAAQLQNLSSAQAFYCGLSVLLVLSSRPRFGWCGTGGFQEQGKCVFIVLSCSIPTIVFY